MRQAERPPSRAEPALAVIHKQALSRCAKCGRHSNLSTYQTAHTQKAEQRLRFFCYSTFLLSGPGVVTMTVSGVMTTAPRTASAPWKCSFAAFRSASTTGPSVS